MNKKGMLLKTLGAVVLGFLIILGTLKAMNTLLGPMWTDNTKSVSWQSYNLLSENIQVLLNSDRDIAMTNAILELETNYYIVGFDYDRTITNAFGAEQPRHYTKPKECPTGSGCLCFYKGKYKKEDVIECRDLGKSKFYHIIHPVYKNKITMGWPAPYHPEKNDRDGNKIEYETIVFVGRTAAIADLTWGTKRLYLETYKEGDVNHILVTFANEEMYVRYYELNTCPDESDADCKDKQYNYAFIEQDTEGNEESFFCGYDEEQKKCLKTNIDRCESEFIRKACACGDVAYDFGICANDEFYINDLPTDYCYSISDCNSYKVGDFDSKEFACTYNLCGVEEIGCYWADTWWDRIKTGAVVQFPCKTCEKDCDCDYSEDWVKEINPCGCDCP